MVRTMPRLEALTATDALAGIGPTRGAVPGRSHREPSDPDAGRGGRAPQAVRRHPTTTLPLLNPEPEVAR
jgi:hypothetical protein